MGAALIIFSVFGGLAFLAAVIMGGIMLATGRYTLPGSPERRVQEANSKLVAARLRLETAAVELNIDRTHQARATLMLGKGEGDNP